MSVPRALIEANLAAVRRRIAEAARRSGRNPETVTLVAVTKTVGLDELSVLADLGVTDVAENRPEQVAAKMHAMAGRVRRHMIGNLQRRKVPEAIELFDRIDAVDRISLAETIEQRCTEKNRTMPVLVEINVSGENSKHGFPPSQLPEVLRTMASMPHLVVEGLMTMAPAVDNRESVRPVFAELRELAQNYGLLVVSMGMSDDFEVAVEEGSTEVRIGSALFH